MPGSQKIVRQQMSKGETFICERGQLWKKSGTESDGWLQGKQKVQSATLENFLVSLYHRYLPFSYIHSVYLIFGDFFYCLTMSVIIQL